MALLSSSAQSIPPNVLNLIFDILEYGQRIVGEWDKAMVYRRRRDNGAESLVSIAQVCRSWRAVALAYLYQNTETFISLAFADSNEQSTSMYPSLSMAAVGGHSLLVHSAHLHLSLDGIEDGSVTRALSTGAFSAATFPGVTDLTITFSSADADMYLGQNSLALQTLRFSDRIRQLFPSTRNYAFTLCPGWLPKDADADETLLEHIAPTPQTLIYRSMANGATANLFNDPATGIRRIHLETDESSDFYPLLRASSDTIEELVLSQCSTEYLDKMVYDEDDQYYTYPKLTKLTIKDDFTSVDDYEESGGAHHFPSLATLNIFTYWDSGISFFVGTNTSTLTSLTFQLSGALLESLQGYMFPNLTRICILEGEYEISGVHPGTPIREFNLPFIIAPNAKQIECNIVCNPQLISPASIVPYSFPNLRLRHLVINHFEPTLSELASLLVSFPRLTRLGILRVRPDLPEGTIYHEETVRTLLAVLPDLSLELRRLDCQWHTHECALVAILVVKLPMLTMVTELLSEHSLAQYVAEIEKPVYDYYRDRLRMPMFCDNLNMRD